MVTGVSKSFRTSRAACLIRHITPIHRTAQNFSGLKLQPQSTQSEFARLPRSQPETDENLVADGVISQLAGTGLEVIDLQSDVAFARRHLHFRDVVSHIEGMNRLARVFVEIPTKILQELVTAAVDLCGADMPVSASSNRTFPTKTQALGSPPRLSILRLCGCKATSLSHCFLRDSCAKAPTDFACYRARSSTMMAV